MRKKAYSLWINFKNLGTKRIIIGGIAVILVILGVFVMWVSTLKLPTLDSFGQSERLAESTKIYDRTGQVVLYDVNTNLRRTVVPFDQISQHAKDAAIAIEDEKFYQHHGIVLLSILRSALVDLATLD